MTKKTILAILLLNTIKTGDVVSSGTTEAIDSYIENCLSSIQSILTSVDCNELEEVYAGVKETKEVRNNMNPDVSGSFAMTEHNEDPVQDTFDNESKSTPGGTQIDIKSSDFERNTQLFDVFRMYIGHISNPENISHYCNDLTGLCYSIIASKLCFFLQKKRMNANFVSIRLLPKICAIANHTKEVDNTDFTFSICLDSDVKYDWHRKLSDVMEKVKSVNEMYISEYRMNLISYLTRNNYRYMKVETDFQYHNMIYFYDLVLDVLKEFEVVIKTDDTRHRVMYVSAYLPDVIMLLASEANMTYKIIGSYRDTILYNTDKSLSKNNFAIWQKSIANILQHINNILTTILNNLESKSECVDDGEVKKLESLCNKLKEPLELTIQRYNEIQILNEKYLAIVSDTTFMSLDVLVGNDEKKDDKSMTVEDLNDTNAERADYQLDMHEAEEESRLNVENKQSKVYELTKADGKKLQKERVKHIHCCGRGLECCVIPQMLKSVVIIAGAMLTGFGLATIIGLLLK